MAEKQHLRYVELNIFDFDGTIFRSPAPSPERWHSASVGRLKATVEPMKGEHEIGFGWFQNPLTLSPPYVPEKPDPSYYIEPVIKRVRQSMANRPAPFDDTPIDPDADVKCVTVLLTGRSELHRDLIMRIVTHYGLKFDEVGLKPLEPVTTMNFKQAFITSLVQKYSPTQIEIFDDRENHVIRFKDFMKKKFADIPFRVHHVQEEPSATYLPEELELKLIEELARQAKRPFEYQRDVRYTGVMLDKESTHLLLSKFPPPPKWKPYAHHMTICMGPINNAADLGLTTDSIGAQVQLRVTDLGVSEKAMAVKVTGCPSINKIPHVTIAVAEDSKPMESNFIESWSPVDEEIVLHGVIDQYTTLSLLPMQKPKKQIPHGLSFGSIIKKYHPNINGKLIGEAVVKIKDWLSRQTIDDDKIAEAVEEYIKSGEFLK